jgi:hypothetical protein
MARCPPSTISPNQPQIQHPRVWRWEETIENRSIDGEYGDSSEDDEASDADGALWQS